MKLQFALALAVLSASAFASVKIQEELYIPGNRPEVVKELIEVGSAEIDHVTSEGFELYGSKGLANYLDQKNIPYMDMKAMKQTSFADYPHFPEVKAKLEALAAKYPKLMKLTSIGQSIKGRDLLVMKISDNVEVDEVEPEFKYISSMHGDEITGRELTIRLIEEIGEKYGKDRELTDLVNNTELFIMPSMNPDGSELHQRGNARGVDLNRNFPDMRETQNSSKGREVETQLVMAYQATRKFSLSANFHGGTIVANYPWDSIYDLHPLNDLVIELSQGYADLNPEMKASREFDGGITNGAQWYIVRGGMQDWSYIWFNDLQITVELSHTKWPSYSDIPDFYRSNRDSMVQYMKEIHRGAGFKISRPGVEGTVAIVDGKSNKDMGSYSFSGSEFYKVLPVGDYIFNVKEKGSASARSLNVRVDKNMIRANGNYQVLN